MKSKYSAKYNCLILNIHLVNVSISVSVMFLLTMIHRGRKKRKERRFDQLPHLTQQENTGVRWAVLTTIKLQIPGSLIRFPLSSIQVSGELS